MDSFGIYSVQQLRQMGWTRDRLAAARADGRWRHVRRGFYAEPDSPPVLVRAVRLGGRATGISALPFHGIWTPRDARLHVLVPRNGGRLRDPDVRAIPLLDRRDVHVHWQDRQPVKENLLRFRALVDAATAVRHAVECSNDETAVAVVDSALHHRLIDPNPTSVAQLLPRGRARLAAHIDGRAESGLESVVRYRLRLAGYRVEPQVVIRGIGRVDLLVEGRLVLELDGRATHLNPEAFENDRRRDLEASRQQLLHLRLTSEQVSKQWAFCLRSIAAALD